MKFTEKDLREVIDLLLSDSEKKLGYSLNPETLKSINNDYENYRFGETVSMKDYIEECLYDYICVNFPVTEVVQAIEGQTNVTIGDIKIEHVDFEAVVRIGSDFVKCLPSKKMYIDSMCPVFYDLELELERKGYSCFSIIKDGTKVQIISSGIIGTVEGNDAENSEDDLSDLNYYVVPEGMTFDDEIMTHKDDLKILPQ